MERVNLYIERVTSGEIAGAWRVSAWSEDDFLGREAFLFYTKREALREARRKVKERGGLGVFARA